MNVESKARLIIVCLVCVIFATMAQTVVQITLASKKKSNIIEVTNDSEVPFEITTPAGKFRVNKYSLINNGQFIKFEINMLDVKSSVFTVIHFNDPTKGENKEP